MKGLGELVLPIGLAAIGALSVSFFIGVSSGSNAAHDIWRGKIIERGHGLYCPDTGKFAFNHECKEPPNDP